MKVVLHLGKVLSEALVLLAKRWKVQQLGNLDDVRAVIGVRIHSVAYLKPCEHIAEVVVGEVVYEESGHDVNELAIGALLVNVGRVRKPVLENLVQGVRHRNAELDIDVLMELLCSLMYFEVLVLENALDEVLELESEIRF